LKWQRNCIGLQDARNVPVWLAIEMLDTHLIHKGRKSKKSFLKGQSRCVATIAGRSALSTCGSFDRRL
jgi:hypothetical protein